MYVRDSVAVQFWRNATIHEARLRYEEAGCVVTLGEMVGDGVADLVARGDRQRVAVVFKSTPWSEGDRENLGRLRAWIRGNRDWELRVVVCRVPAYPQVEVSGLEGLLCRGFAKKMPGTEVDTLGTHTALTAISDLDVERLVITDGCVELAGSVVLEVALRYGSDADAREDGSLESEESIPATFQVEVEARFGPCTVRALGVDRIDDLSDEEEVGGRSG